MDCPSDAQKFDRSCRNVHTAIGLSVNFPWVHRIFRQLPSNFCASEQLSVNFPHIRGIFLQLLSTCRVSVGLSVNFCECSVHLWDFTSILNASVNFRQLSVHPGNMCQLSLYLRDLQRTSVNFPCVSTRGIFCQLFVRPQILL